MLVEKGGRGWGGFLGGGSEREKLSDLREAGLLELLVAFRIDERCSL